MTLRIAAFLALVASYTAAYVAKSMARVYSEMYQSSPLPQFTQTIIWQHGVLYWAFLPAIIITVWYFGEKTESTSRRQRHAGFIMILGTASIIFFIMGIFLPLTTTTFTLE
jgi:hypothetical protein